MADEAQATTGTSDTQSQATNPNPREQQANQPAGGDTSGRTFTEAELNAMMTDRLSKHERSLRKQWEKEQADAKREAEMTAEERANELKTTLETKDQEIARLKQERADERALYGKVQDLDYALYKLGDGEKYRDKDGKLDVDAFLKDHPNIASQPEPRRGPAPTSGGGGTQFNTADMNTLIRRKAGR